MGTYYLHAKIEADSLEQAMNVASALPNSFSPEAAAEAAKAGLREFRLTTWDDEGRKRGISASLQEEEPYPPVQIPVEFKDTGTGAFS